MAKYIVDPILVKMKESERGSIYRSVVAMGVRARQINDDIRYEMRVRTQDITQQADDVPGNNHDLLRITREFENMSKPTFISMREMYDDKLKLSYDINDPKFLNSEE